MTISINGEKCFTVNKTRKLLPINSSAPAFKMCSSINKMLLLKSLNHTEQCFRTTEGSLTLNHVSVDTEVTVDDEYQEQIHRIMKKRLPSKIQIQLLYAPAQVIAHFMTSFLFLLDVSIIIIDDESKFLTATNEQYEST